MITFDMLTLKAFLKEEKDFLTGAKINKIQQPTRREFVFTLRNNGVSRQFYVNITPQMYHVCFMSKENYLKRYINIPKQPPMFCMQLRKYLENSRISKVVQPENERILEIYVETYSETGDKIYLCLAIELMGKYSNVILYNYDTNVIIGSAHNVGAEKSREREVYGGIPYIYPPRQLKIDILKYFGEVNYENLNSEFYGFSKAFANLCVGVSLDKLKQYINLENLTPSISFERDIYCLYKELLEGEVASFSSVNEMIDIYYANHIENEKFKTQQQFFKSVLLHKFKRLEKSISQMKTQISANNSCDKYRLYGDLLMANLYNLADYSENAKVFDYENNKEITISLDKLKTVKENANYFYKLYNKGKTSKIKLTELITNSVNNLEYLDQILYSINSSKTLGELEEIRPEVEENTVSKKHQPALSDVEMIEMEDGSRIYIGKNNRQNDKIISKISDEDDLWFHVYKCAGSHILLKSKNPTDELIYRCAKLAKEYSNAKNSVKVGVIYTKRKYLRKPPGANLGYVTYKNEKEIVV